MQFQHELLTTILRVERRQFYYQGRICGKKEIQSPVVLTLWMMRREQWENLIRTSIFYSLSFLIIFVVNETRFEGKGRNNELGVGVEKGQLLQTSR